MSADEVAPDGLTGSGAAVWRSCRTLAAGSRPGTFRQSVDDVATRLASPLRVALAGRVSAGKSTLANALLGVPVAETAAGECTRVATWYEFGEQDEAVVVGDDGSRIRIDLTPERTLPTRLPLPWERIESLHVRLYSSALRDLTLIDTPGLASVDETTSTRAVEILTARSNQAARAADALIYVVTRHLREDDQQTLVDFARPASGLRASAINTIVVLTKIDKLAEPGADLRAASSRLLARIREDAGSRVGAVVPVVGLLAQTADCGQLDEHAAARVRALGQLDDRDRILTIRAAVGLDRDSAGGQSGRTETNQLRPLLRRLDVHGLMRCADWAADGHGSAAELLTLCSRESGIEALRTALWQVRARASLIRVESALAGLRSLSGTADPADAHRLSATLHEVADELAMDPDSARLRTIAVERALSAGEISLPDHLATDLVRFVTSSTPQERLGLTPDASSADLRAAGLSAAKQWRAFTNDPRTRGAERAAAATMTAAVAAEIARAES